MNHRVTLPCASFLVNDCRSICEQGDVDRIEAGTTEDNKIATGHCRGITHVSDALTNLLVGLARAGKQQITGLQRQSSLSYEWCNK